MTIIRRAAFAPFPPDKMYALVNDVEAYPQFLPWCETAVVLSLTDEVMNARLKVKKGRLDYVLTTANQLTPGRTINLELIDGPFRKFHGVWDFAAADGGCLIDFSVDFEFSSRILGAVLAAAFRPIADSMVDAFKARAHDIYEH
jgi:ribosome-associated toxin RatA of RatAB toxin-antitoxin module